MAEVLQVAAITISIVIGLFGYLYIINKFYYSINLFYLIVFIRGIVLPNARVRERVTIELFIIVFLLLAAYINHRIARIKINNNAPCFKEICVFLIIVIPIEVIIGLANHYGLFGIAVDVYKMIEIVIFFLLIQKTWTRCCYIDKSFSLLIVEMCIFGIIEIFTTNRGGIGFNMLMSVLPIYFAVGITKKTKLFYVVVGISTLIALLSQTRTYIIALSVGLLIIMLYTKNKKKYNYILGLLLIGILTIFIICIIIQVTGSNLFEATINRFAAMLENGFSGAGGYRIYEIRTALSKFMEAPIFGKGYGYHEYLYIPLRGYFDWGDFMHNTYVEILCKTGLFGTIIYTVGIVLYLKKINYLMEKAKKQGQRSVNAWLIGGIGGTVSWMIVYFAAPLSSYGYVFLPGIFSLIFYQRYQEANNKKELA